MDHCDYNSKSSRNFSENFTHQIRKNSIQWLRHRRDLIHKVLFLLSGVRRPIKCCAADEIYVDILMN